MTKYLVVLGDGYNEVMKIEVQAADPELLASIGEKLAALLGLRFWYIEEQ